MKKSTLITTIAMIVVVVVALSTATYAWFSADSKAYATQTINTTAATDIVVLANTTQMFSNENKAVFSGNTLLQYTQGVSVTGIRQGLWAPTTAIATVASGADSATDSFSSAYVSFLSGTQDATGTTFKCSTAATATSADMIRVTAMKSGNIDLTIYIAAMDNEASQFAAQGVSFYIASSTAKIANSAYTRYSGSTLAQNDTATISTSFTPEPATGTITYNATYEQAKADAEEAEQAAPPVINHRATSITPGTLFETAVQADTDPAYKSGLVGYTSWYSMTISLGNFNANESKNFILYNWLDGAYLTDAAGSANIGISYAFAFHV